MLMSHHSRLPSPRSPERPPNALPLSECLATPHVHQPVPAAVPHLIETPIKPSAQPPPPQKLTHSSCNTAQAGKTRSPPSPPTPAPVRLSAPVAVPPLVLPPEGTSGCLGGSPSTSRGSSPHTGEHTAQRSPTLQQCQPGEGAGEGGEAREGQQGSTRHELHVLDP